MFEFLATLATGLFAGAAGYISIVEHWARLEAGAAVALAQFRPGFPRARGIQATLAVLGGVSSLGAWFSGGGSTWLVVAGLMLGIVAFTLLTITPLYNRLLDPALTWESPDTLPTLQRWGVLHHLRSTAGLIAFLVALERVTRAAG
jgi:Domain of unknown function (DUF1772)